MGCVGIPCLRGTRPDTYALGVTSSAGPRLHRSQGAWVVGTLVLVSALALIPVADGLVIVLHGNGHAQCPIHASAAILAEAYAWTGLVAKLLQQSGR
jgi:hypothetical protein